MKVGANFAPQSLTASAAPAAAQPKNEAVVADGYKSTQTEDLGLMPKPQAAAQEDCNAIAAGATYGAAIGVGLGVALGCATMGVGIIVTPFTALAGAAIGTIGGAVVELFK